MRYKRKLQKEIMCPLEYGLEIFGGKWKSRIICVLYSHNTLRYNQLKKELTTISDAVLAEYNLSEKGLSVLPILQSICNWSKTNSVEKLEKKFPACKSCNQLK